MSDNEWAAVMGVLEECWPGEWTARTGPAYRILLGGYSASAVLAALRKVSADTKRVLRARPSGSELVSALEEDPERPTFEDMFDAVFGSGRILRARSTARRWGSEAERHALYCEAVERRAAEFHPLIAGFVVNYGVFGLSRLELDGEYGGLRRKDLREAWDRFVAAREGMERHAIAAGSRAGLRQLSPLKALGVEPDRPRLTAVAGS